MKILLKSCKIICPNHVHHLQVKDILIHNELIEKIEDSLTEEVDKVVTGNNLHVSLGWFDTKVNFSDPGNEIKEDLATGLKSAELGGMTAVSTKPNTVPTISNKSQINYIINNAQFSPVNVHPLGTLTENMAGKNIAEFYDMKNAGAVGFTDCNNDVSAGIMYRALAYANNFNGKIISSPFDKSIFGVGQINESKSSVLTGLKSIPDLSEYIVVQRDIAIAEYAKSPIHFTGISTAKSVELIREAQQKGLEVTADVHVHNLLFTDEDTLNFDTNYKVLPPLRTEIDRLALINGIKDGTISIVCSDHTPEDTESKDTEFGNSAFGIIGTQTLFSALNTLNSLTIEEKIAVIADNPRKIYNINADGLSVGKIANITIFDPETEWVLKTEHLASKSKNSPFINKTLKGKAVGIINKGILSIFE